MQRPLQFVGIALLAIAIVGILVWRPWQLLHAPATMTAEQTEAPVTKAPTTKAPTTKAQAPPVPYQAPPTQQAPPATTAPAATAEAPQAKPAEAPQPQPQPQPAQAKPAEPKPVETQTAQKPAEPKVAESKPPETRAPQTQPSAAPPPAAKPLPQAATPEFDVVRVESGHAVIAGRAAPGAEVSVLDGDQVFGNAKATGQGEWVMMPTTSLKPGTHELTLAEKLPDGHSLKSEHQVLLVVPEPEQLAANGAKGGTNSAGTGALAIAVPEQGGGPSKLLQKPTLPGKGVKYHLNLDVIDYGEAGKLSLAGRGITGDVVQVYLDNAFIGRAAVDSQGHWTLVPDKEVVPGHYSLRLDELDGNDKVIGRLMVPFERAKPNEELTGKQRVVVQRGDSLWRIARQSYGVGVRYTVIYQANRDQIQNPNRIYPGQLFLLPTHR